MHQQDDDRTPGSPAVADLPDACAALTAAVDVLTTAPLPSMWGDQLQGLLAAVVPQVQRLQGLVATAAGHLQTVTGGTVGTGDGGSRSTIGWVAETCRESGGVAGGMVRRAVTQRDLPLVVQAVLDGRLTQAHADILARLLGPIGTEHVQASQAALIQVAAGRTPVELAEHVRHLIATHSEPTLDDDEKTAQDKRYLQARRDADGMVRGRFAIPGEDGETLLTAIEPLARRDGLTDQRSAGQRRADALVALAEFLLRHGTDLPDTGGQRPQLSYLLPADWAARQQHRDTCGTCRPCPAHRPVSFADTVAASLPGHPGVPAEHACATAAWTGPQTRPRLEALLCDARISRVLLDGVGQVRGLETLTDSVTNAQRRALAARDSGCTTRGCTRPPAFCDAHHLIALADGGPTTLGNLVLLCRRHHVLWHRGQLRLADLHIPWHPSSSSNASGTDPPF
jgi:hypothetical protein